MKRKRPIKLDGYPSCDYPTLSEFGGNRRTLIKGLAAGAIALSSGSLVIGCLNAKSDTEKGDAEVDFPIHDTGIGPGVEYWRVQLPAEEHRHTYLQTGYLHYRVVFITYQQDLADYFTAHPEKGLDACDAVLSRLDCSDFPVPQPEEEEYRPPDMGPIYTSLKEALLETYQADGGDTDSSIESLVLEVDVCDSMPMMGEPPEPEYPDDSQ